MSQIVSLFRQTVVVFCLTIAVVYADQADMAIPQVVIDLSPVVELVRHQLAQLWLVLTLAGLGLALAAYGLLNRLRHDGPASRGDELARSVSLVWLVFLVLMVLGLALPLVRLMTVLMSGTSGV